MAQASFVGVLRTMATAILVWWVVKAVLRIAKAIKRPPSHPPKKGEMRIERIDEKQGVPVPRPTHVEDAEYEEVDQTNM